VISGRARGMARPAVASPRSKRNELNGNGRQRDPVAMILSWRCFAPAKRPEGRAAGAKISRAIGTAWNGQYPSPVTRFR